MIVPEPPRITRVTSKPRYLQATERSNTNVISRPVCICFVDCLSDWTNQITINSANMATANGHCSAAGLDHVFPEALSSLKLADPEMYQIIQDEKTRQW